ncbi:MAG TPA: tetratricopeptide repeat protein [Gemmatimonadales bacterium]|nr:tetratricopeptide repeat protein [Gemmatimonadales bacterium]
MATTVEARPTRRADAPAPDATPWYKDRTRRLILGVGAVLVVALGVWLAITSGKRKEAFAARMLSQAIATADRGNLAQASGELQRVIETYRGTEAAGEAVLALNWVRLNNNQAALAAQDLREFLASKPPARFAAPAYALLGAAEESSNRYAEAGRAYEDAGQLAEFDHLRGVYLVDAGRAYRLAGKTEDAVRVYRTVVEKYAQTPSAAEAQVRLAELTAGTA